ncbi:hypothetical protein AAE478_006424 [Parahypoxylon ruwenzoriense]
MDFMNQVTDKPNWVEKVFDETIIAEWREEASSGQPQNLDLDGDVFFSSDMFEYCIKELRDKAEKAKKTGIVNIFDAEVGVAKSDTIISPPLADALKAGVRGLEDVPDILKDWQPGSDKKVLDLLHPSLFPLVHGKTRVLPRGKVPLENCASFIGKGQATHPWEQRPLRRPAMRREDQWLPSDIEWTEAGTRIASYINNLHPVDHSDLYKVLGQFVAAAVPLWEQCLFRREERLTPRISIATKGNEDFYLPDGVEYTIPEDYVNTDDEYGDYKYTSEYQEWFSNNKILSWPEPDEYQPRERSEGPLHLKARFPEGLQVIFKLANIHLNPEDPEYYGGTWHIEGALNDRIAATALYYYDMENITDSRLEFRQSLDGAKLSLMPPEGEFESLDRWLGTNDIPLQHLGGVVTRSGRLLAFPNIFQHEVHPFRLQDRTKPGHRKLLAMFLVDPHTRVLSTGVVPPQRRDWWAPEVRKVRPFCSLPREVFDIIIEQVDGFPMSWDDALEARNMLMRERSWVNRAREGGVTEVGRSGVRASVLLLLTWNQDTFNFCEN